MAECAKIWRQRIKERKKRRKMKSLSKSRTAQLIFQSFYCALALVACVGSVGTYNMRFVREFYLYFTNISTYLAAAGMALELIGTARRDRDGAVQTAPEFHFVVMLGVLLTFMVYNFLLPNTLEDRLKVESILCHVVLPVLYTADWLLFYEHGRVTWKLPLLSALFPLIYLAFVYVHAALWHFDASIPSYAGTNPMIYPYFFLDPQIVGLGGIVKWTFILLAAFAAGGYLFLGIDRVLAVRKKNV